ncbi:hypothetical protein ACR2W7_20775, partial [Klebsiella pneumoniae]
MAATPYPAYGALYIKRLLNTVGPPGKLYQTPFPSLCRMAATPYPAYGALYIKRLRNTVGPRKRSAAGQAVPDPVPVVVPD